ncbi:Flp pilus assembly protein CpaB [Desulfohalotomaculum tongense]|uniref:Flp pilus assembly protein CpaB n=1 Tax=Desulforadius tongensis TaxID=1216062 RepID=UPI00195E6335|nr:RcpC/CpaB family pilus assembly protein [Desulforadius tongensis]MBM7854942.1 Flp pilus assembly protein CpaB [Desulforadius tongensis]
MKISINANKGKFNKTSFLNKRLAGFMVIVFSLTLAGLGTYKLRDYLIDNRPTEQVLVAGRDIMPYSVITSEDIKYIEIPLGSSLSGTAKNPKEVIGKRANTVLYKNEQILLKKLSDSSLIVEEDEGLVGIPVDAIRAVGFKIRPGDVVDIYWINDRQSSDLPTRKSTDASDEVERAQLVAEQAVIIDVLDKRNVSIYKQALLNAPEEAMEEAIREKKSTLSMTAVAVIKIKNKDVENVITAIGNGTSYFCKRAGGS